MFFHIGYGVDGAINTGALVLLSGYVFLSWFVTQRLEARLKRRFTLPTAQVAAHLSLHYEGLIYVSSVIFKQFSYETSGDLQSADWHKIFMTYNIFQPAISRHEKTLPPRSVVPAQV